MTEGFTRAWQHQLAELQQPKTIYWAISLDDEWHVFDSLKVAIYFAARSDEMGVPTRHRVSVRACTRAIPRMGNIDPAEAMLEDVVRSARKWSDFESGEDGPFLWDEEAHDELHEILHKTFERWMASHQGRGVWIYAWRFAGPPRQFERHEGQWMERTSASLFVPPELSEQGVSP